MQKGAHNKESSEKQQGVKQYVETIESMRNCLVGQAVLFWTKHVDICSIGLVQEVYVYWVVEMSWEMNSWAVPVRWAI